MAAKIHEYDNNGAVGVDGSRVYWFYCPGCKDDHGFAVGGRGWTWNGSFDKPTFTPSLLCNKDDPGSRCHSIVTDGKIAFQQDCWHGLKGQTVDLPD